MHSKRLMLIAGEPSGDALAAELVRALTAESNTGWDCFGAGGPQMAAAGVKLDLDLTRHSVIGLWEVLKQYGTFKHIFDQLLQVALERKPDGIICVDFSGFNRRFAHRLRWETQLEADAHSGLWRPKVIQYVSPQVWASRPGRARSLAKDFDLLLALFPFEKKWYAERTPRLPVEWVGHPICDRYRDVVRAPEHGAPLLLLLPGSREGELRRHLPVMLAALQGVRATRPDLRARLILPNPDLAQQARTYLDAPETVEVRTGALAPSLATATVALASTGTVTLECAYFGLPTVALYKTSWSTYQIGRRLIQVRHLAMPNVLAAETVIPEFIQDEATPEKLSAAILGLLNDPRAQEAQATRLRQIAAALGGPGASRRAAQAVIRCLASDS